MWLILEDEIQRRIKERLLSLYFVALFHMFQQACITFIIKKYNTVNFEGEK